MSKQKNSGKVAMPRASTQRNRSDANTKPGTVASKAAVRIEGYSLRSGNVGPDGAPYQNIPPRKDYP